MRGVLGYVWGSILGRHMVPTGLWGVVFKKKSGYDLFCPSSHEKPALSFDSRKKLFFLYIALVRRPILTIYMQGSVHPMDSLTLFRKKILYDYY